MDLEFDPDGMAAFLTTDYENKKSRRKKIKDAPKTRLQQPKCDGA